MRKIIFVIPLVALACLSTIPTPPRIADAPLPTSTITSTAQPQVIPDPAELAQVAVHGSWYCRTAPNSYADVQAYLSDGAQITLTATTRGGWTLVYWLAGEPPCWVAGY